MSNENISTEQLYKNMMIVWLGLFSSQFIFLIVIYSINPKIFNFDFSKPIFGENLPIIIGFAFFGVLNLIISFVMKKNLINNAIEHQKPALVQTGMIIACALCESVTIFGLVLAIAFNFQFFFVFFILGLLGMILHFPKRDNLHMATFKKTQNL